MKNMHLVIFNKTCLLIITQNATPKPQSFNNEIITYGTVHTMLPIILHLGKTFILLLSYFIFLLALDYFSYEIHASFN